jgi:hypothetical protein
MIIQHASRSEDEMRNLILSIPRQTVYRDGMQTVMGNLLGCTDVSGHLTPQNDSFYRQLSCRSGPVCYSSNVCHQSPTGTF